MWVLLLLAIPSIALGADLSTEDVPKYHAQDPRAELVTEKNLLASERFWPFHVALVRPWKPAGRAAPLQPNINGVLIRVEASGLARIDFGRDGAYEVPVGETDLVERANRIRLGELDKMAPNLLLALGTKLIDSESDPPRTFPFMMASERRAFLCIFADPSGEALADLAKTLASLRERPGLLTILFPLGSIPDPVVRERLRTLNWTVPFVHDHLADTYLRSLLGADAQLPAVLLTTREGRPLFQSPWRADMAKLKAAVDAALAPAP